MDLRLVPAPCVADGGLLILCLHLSSPGIMGVCHVSATFSIGGARFRAFPLTILIPFVFKCHLLDADDKFVSLACPSPLTCTHAVVLVDL